MKSQLPCEGGDSGIYCITNAMTFSPSQAGFLWDAETQLSEKVIKGMWVPAHRGFVLSNLQIFTGVKQLMPRLATRMKASSLSSLTHTDISSEPCTKQAAELRELIMAQRSQGTLLLVMRL